MLRHALLRGLFARNICVNATSCSKVRPTVKYPTEQLGERNLRFLSEFVSSRPTSWTENDKPGLYSQDGFPEDDSSDSFADCSRLYSSRRSFRKTSADQLDLKYTDEEDTRREKFISKTGRKNTPYWYFLKCKKLIKKDKLAEALVLFEKDMLKGEKLQPEEFNYTVLIGGCGRVGYVKKAFQLYNSMKKRGLEPTDATYTGLFNACAESPWKQSGLDQAMKLKQELLKRNITLSAITHHALLKTVALAGDLKSCFQIIRTMLQSGQPVSQETFHYLLIGCVKDKENGFRLALQIWHQMHRIGIKPDAVNYNILLRVARDCGIGDPELASMLLLKQKEEFSIPKLKSVRKSDGRKVTEKAACHPLDMDAFEKIIFQEKNTQGMDVNKAAAQDNERESNPLKKNYRLITDTAEDKAIPVALTLAESFPCHSDSKRQSPPLPNLLDPHTCHSDVIALGPVSRASDRLALIGNLEGFLDKMVRDGLKPNIKTITLLADIIDPDSQSVTSLINVAKECGVKLDVTFFNTVIRSVAKNGNLDGAKAVMAIMCKKGLVANAQTYCSAALACRKETEGFQLLSEMESVGVAANAHVYSALIAQAVKRLDYSYLHKLLRHMHKQQMPPNDVIIRQLEFAAQYPPSYDKLKSRNIYMDKIDGFRGFYTKWLEFMPGQETPHPWDKYRPQKSETDPDKVNETVSK